MTVAESPGSTPRRTGQARSGPGPPGESPDGRRPRILVCDRISDAGLDLLRAHFDVDVATGLDEEELISRIGGYEGVVVRSATRITERVVDHAHQLVVIARAGSGLDAIDVGAAVARGIEVVNSPGANTLAVAELTMALILGLARNVARADAALKQGRWEKKDLVGVGLADRTLGIIGFGRIGQAVARRATGFGMRILTNQRRPTPELYLEAGVEPVDMYRLLEESDVVSLHVPLREETRGLIGERELAAMKPTAYLVNTSRGAVVDEDALLEALESGTIAGAGLDVFVEEPPRYSALVRHPRVLATPHIGASTQDAQEAAAIDVARQLVTMLEQTHVRPVLPLQVVALDRVSPHEAIDPRRAGELAARLEEDGVIRNPPVVTRVGDGFVVLDGATRGEALRRLDCRDAVVQVVDVGDRIGLETWNHVIRRIDATDLVDLLRRVEGIETTDAEREEVQDRVIETAALCSVTTVDGRSFVVDATPGTNRFEAMATLAGAYLEGGRVSRTLERDIRRLRSWYPDMTALVEYPEFTVDQVLLAARSGRLLPAGVTRFVVPGRVLRLDVPLSLLRSDDSPADKNRWLYDHLAEKERQGKIRFYREPVYILDE